MQGLNTVFLGIIAAVLVGAAVVWWIAQPSADERRQSERDAVFERLEDSVDRYEETSRRLRSIED